MPWRNRFASASTSWACSRRSASATAGSSSLVLLESCTIAFLGGGLGLLIGWTIITVGGDPTGGMLPIFHFPPRDLVLGAVLVLVLGIGTGLLPAFQASRLKIVDALRRI